MLPQTRGICSLNKERTVVIHQVLSSSSVTGCHILCVVSVGLSCCRCSCSCFRLCCPIEICNVILRCQPVVLKTLILYGLRTLILCGFVMPACACSVFSFPCVLWCESGTLQGAIYLCFFFLLFHVFLSVNLGPYMEPFISVSSSSNNVELPFISVFFPFSLCS